MPPRTTKREIRKVLADANLVWEPETSRTPGSRDYISARCLTCGYTWEVRYDKIKEGRGCPNCAGFRRYTDEDYHALAKEQGIEWTGENPGSVKRDTQWQIPNGRPFVMSYENVRDGRWKVLVEDPGNSATTKDGVFVQKKFIE